MIPVIDLRLLTQAELNTLAISSEPSSTDSRRCGDDVVIPKIDRSVFNESAGSRKQTYSRLRLAPPKSTPSNTPSTGRRRGRPRSISIATTPTSSSIPDSSAAVASSEDSGRKENDQIVKFLRQLFAKNGRVEMLETVSVPSSNHTTNPSSTSNPSPQYVAGMTPGHIPTDSNAKPNSQQKKRGRKKKRVEEVDVGSSADLKGEGRDDETMNGSGVPVDLVALAQKEGLFKDELAKRTVGLTTEEEFLEFLNGLGGQWGSRRKRRKIVDAGTLGNELPKGWKVILGLKRNEGRVWVQCRRYVSPSGKQFASCKEISAYLLSLVGSQMSSTVACVAQNEDTLTDKFNIGCDAGNTHANDNEKDMLNFSSGAPAFISTETQKQGSVSMLENPAKSQLLNHLECPHCNLKFSDKATHVEHLLTFHQKNVKRCRFGKSISSGVIIKDGNFECQFCHKIFTERHRYNGHVGIHVRNYDESLELLTDNVVIEEGIEEQASLVVEPVAFEANSTEPSEKAILANDTCTPGPICENNASTSFTSNNKNLGTDCNPDSNMAESTDNASSTKFPYGRANHHEGKVEKLGNNSDNSHATNIEHYACLGFGSHAKQLAPESTTKLSKNTIPESTLESCSKSVIGQADRLNMEDGELQNVVDPSCTMDMEFNNCSKVCNDLTYMPSQASSNTLIATGKIIGQDSRIVNNVSSVTGNADVNVSSDAETACDSKCNMTESIDKITTIGKSNDQIDGCNMIDGKSNSIAEAGSATLSDFGRVPGNTTPGTESSMFVTRQLDVNNTVNENLRNSIQTDKARNNDNDSSTICAGNIFSETSTKKCPVSIVSDENDDNPGVRKAFVDTPLDNLSCNWQESTEDSIFSYREIDELDNSLCDQHLYHESNLDSLPSPVQSYDVQTNADDMLTENIEKCDIVEANDYGRQDCITVPSGAGEACGVEVQMGDKDLSDVKDSVALKIREPCNELDIDLGFGFSGTNKDSMMDNELVGGSTIDSGLFNQSSLWSQPSNCLSAADVLSDQGTDNKFCSAEQKHKYPPGLEELRMDDVGLSNSLSANQAPGLCPEDATGLDYNGGGLGNVFAAPGKLEWEMTAPGMVDRHQQITTVCMWCSIEFSQDSITLQPQPDSIGFICPTCKSKISGQLKF